jgi:hypothetical protein
MDKSTVFARTAKGLFEFRDRSATLPKELHKVLGLIDGKRTLGELGVQLGPGAVKALLLQVRLLSERGLIKEVPRSGGGGEPLRRPPAEQSVDDNDLDFTNVLVHPGLPPASPASSEASGPANSKAPAARLRLTDDPRERVSGNVGKRAQEQPVGLASETGEARADLALQSTLGVAAASRLPKVAELMVKSDEQSRVRFAEEGKARIAEDKWAGERAERALTVELERRQREGARRQREELETQRRREEEAESARKREQEAESARKREQEDQIRQREEEEAHRLREKEAAAARKREEEAQIRQREEEEAHRLREEEAAAARQREEMEQARLLEEQKAQRRFEEEAAARKREEEELARRREEQEARRRREEEAVAARKREEQEAQRLREEEAAAARRREAEEQARRREEEEAARQREEQEAQRRREEEARKREEEEQARRREEEEAARQREEQEAQRRREEEERTRKEEARKREEEEQARQREELEAQQRFEEEAAARKREEQELARQREELEAQRHREEEAAAARKREEDEQARQREEEKAARQREEQEAQRRRDEEAAAERKREEEEQARRREVEEAARRWEEERPHRREQQRAAPRREDQEARRRPEAELAEVGTREGKEQDRQRGAEVLLAPDKGTEEELRKALEAQQERIKLEEQARLAVEAAELEAQRRAANEARAQAELTRREQEKRDRLAREEAAKRAREEAERKEKEAEERKRREEEARKRAEVERLTSEQRMREAALAKQRAQQAERDRQNAARKALLEQSRKTPWKRTKPVLIGLTVLLISMVAFLQFLPVAFLIPAFEAGASRRIGEPVSIAEMSMSVVPDLRFRLSGVKIGMRFDVKAKSVTLYPQWESLFSGPLVVKRLVAEELAVEAEALPRVAAWGPFKAGRGEVVVERLQLQKVVLAGKGIQVPAFDADLPLGSDGKITGGTLRLSDGTLGAELDAGAETVEVSGRGFTLPFGPAVVFDEVTASVNMIPDGIKLTGINGRLYGGNAKGNATLRWGAGWSLAGEFQLQRVQLYSIMQTIGNSGKAAGQLDAGARFEMNAVSAEKLFDAPVVQSAFSVVSGSVDGIDLIRALQAQNRSDAMQGGKTRFESLSGTLGVSGARFQYRDLKLASGLFTATGALDILPNRDVAGRLAVELKSPSGEYRNSYSLTGNLDSLALKY